MSDRNAHLRWLPALLLMSVIAFVSHQSNPMAVLAPLAIFPRLGELLVHFPDYAAHFVEYFCLTLSIGYALHRHGTDRAVRKTVTTLLVVALFALSDELHQAYIPRRTPDILDFGADMLGTFGALIVLGLSRLLNRCLELFVSNLQDPDRN